MQGRGNPEVLFKKKQERWQEEPRDWVFDCGAQVKGALSSMAAAEGTQARLDPMLGTLAMDSVATR